jgi:hypothetical protein
MKARITVIAVIAALLFNPISHMWQHSGVKAAAYAYTHLSEMETADAIFKIAKPHLQTWEQKGFAKRLDDLHQRPAFYDDIYPDRETFGRVTHEVTDALWGRNDVNQRVLDQVQELHMMQFAVSQVSWQFYVEDGLNHRFDHKEIMIIKADLDDRREKMEALLAKVR